MDFALGSLAWPPDRFWAATPRELSHAFAGRFGRDRRAPLGRSALDEMMARWPDSSTKQEHSHGAG